MRATPEAVSRSQPWDGDSEEGALATLSVQGVVGALQCDPVLRMLLLLPGTYNRPAPFHPLRCLHALHPQAIAPDLGLLGVPWVTGCCLSTWDAVSPCVMAT